MVKFDEIQLMNKILGEKALDYWLNQVFLSYQWWIILLSILVPWILWWIIVDKKRVKEMTLVSILIALISFILDQTGAALEFWAYPKTLTPISRDVWDPADLAILPLFYMMIYQYFPTWKKYLLMHFLFSLFAVYVGGSIYQWLGIYKIIKWKMIYSVPIYFILGVLIKWIMIKLTNLENKHKGV